MRRQRRVWCGWAFALDSKPERRWHHPAGRWLRRRRFNRRSRRFDDALNGRGRAGFDDGFGCNRLDDRWRQFNHGLFDDRRRRRRRRHGRHFGLRNGSREGRGLHRFHETRRWKGRGCRLRRFRRLLRGSPAFSSLDDRRFRKDVARRQRNLALPREPIDKLPRNDLFDRARRALDLDAMVTLEQSRDFLARGVQQLRNLIYPDSGQPLTSNPRSIYSPLSRSG